MDHLVEFLEEQENVKIEIDGIVLERDGSQIYVMDESFDDLQLIAAVDYFWELVNDD